MPYYYIHPFGKLDEIILHFEAWVPIENKIVYDDDEFEGKKRAIPLVGSCHMEHLSKRHVDHDMPSFEMPLEGKKHLTLEQREIGGDGIVLKSTLTKVAI
jgi:hypothetical protein